MPYTSGSPTVLAQLTSLIWGHGAFGNVMLTSCRSPPR